MRYVDMIEDELHLVMPVGPRAVCIEMHCYPAKCTCRVFDVSKQSAQVSEALFLTPHLILSVGQRDRMDISHRPPREHREPMDRISIFALHRRLDAASLLKSDVNRSKRIIQFQSLRDLLSDKPIPASSHAVVEFGEQQKIFVFQGVVISQGANNTVKYYPAFDIPSEGLYLTQGTCFVACAKLFINYCIQYRLRLVANGFPQRRGFHLRSRFELQQLGEMVVEVVIEDRGRP